MRQKILAYSILGLGLPLNAFADAPKVAVDIAPLHSLVSQVMDGAGTPELIIPAGASPHHFSLRPSQARALSEAQTVFWIGEELTPWLQKAMDNVAGSAEKIAVLDLDSTTTYGFREGATFEKHAHHEEEGHHDEHDEHDEHGHEDEHDEHGHHDEHEHHDEHAHDHEPGLLDKFLSFFSSHDEHEEHHDEHGEHDEHHDNHEEHHDEHDEHHDEHAHDGIDPHAWLDPENAKVWVTEIKKVLSEQDPENAETYASNAEKTIAELDRLINDTQDKISGLGDVKFVVFHDAYQYFEKRFGISAAGSISLGDAEDPSPARIAEIQNTVQKLGVTCVFSEPQYNAGLVNNVFEGSNVTAKGVMDPLGASIEPGKNHYSSLIQAMADSLSTCKQ